MGDSGPNPIWDELQALIRAGAIHFDQRTNAVKSVSGHYGALSALVARSSKTIPDPVLVDLIVSIALDEVVEVEAGVAYWSYVLAERGKNVTAYELKPPRRAWYVPECLDSHRAALRRHDEATLLCMNDTAPYKRLSLAMAKYGGKQVVFAADDDPWKSKHLRKFLESDWRLNPHSVVTVHARNQLRVVCEMTRALPEWGEDTRAWPVVSREGL